MANSIRMRANLEGDVTTVRALISHPMDTGLAKNKKTGDFIPAHFIQEVVCEHNGNTVMTSLWGPAISTNPYLSFRFSGAKKGDTLKMCWVDNKGESDSAEATVA